MKHEHESLLPRQQLLQLWILPQLKPLAQLRTNNPLLQVLREEQHSQPMARCPLQLLQIKLVPKAC